MTYVFPSNFHILILSLKLSPHNDDQYTFWWSVELDYLSNVVTKSFHFITILLVTKKSKYKWHWVHLTFAKTLVPLLLSTRQYLLITYFMNILVLIFRIIMLTANFRNAMILNLFTFYERNLKYLGAVCWNNLQPLSWWGLEMSQPTKIHNV
jgi:hypothetical protein